MDSSTSPVPDSTLKRKRDDTPTAADAPTPVSKASRTAPTSGANSLSINYLARQSQDDLPLVNKDDTLPNLLQLLASYGCILDRHESLASNLGARPLGPILIKRFERCFDSPPRVVASHHKSAASALSTGGGDEPAAQQITWLEVIEFARSHPSQFTLSTFSEGKRVCQFYYPQKQLRVQISEEDFLFINSGRCQELIPPLPIWEDEEKEVATCDVLEAKLKELTNAADMVAARTRQLSHRLKGRRAAILERRAEGGYGTPAKANAIQPTTAPPASVASGFTAVNSAIERPGGERSEQSLGLSTNVRHDLLRHFESLPQNQAQVLPRLRRPSMALGDASSRPIDMENIAVISNASSLSPAPHSAYGHDHFPGVSDSVHGARPSTNGGQTLTPSQAGLKHNFSRPLAPALEERQPFRPLCQAHMDSLPRGQRVLPPCDRCRRLKMDCVKNLTSCQGCTKKHARCHWREVSREELGTLDHLMDAQYTLSLGAAGQHGADAGNDDSDDDDSNPLEDLEALGEKEERERLRDDVDETPHGDIAATPTAADYSRSRIWLNGSSSEHHRPSSSHALESPVSASSSRSDRGPSGIVDSNEQSPPRSKVHDLSRLLYSMTGPSTRQAGIFDSLSPDAGSRAVATSTTTSRTSSHIAAITSSTPTNGDLLKEPQHQPSNNPAAATLAPFDTTAAHAHGGFRAVNETPTSSAASPTNVGVGVMKNPAWQTV